MKGRKEKGIEKEWKEGRKEGRRNKKRSEERLVEGIFTKIKVKKIREGRKKE